MTVIEPASWPHIKFSERGAQRLSETAAFLDKLDAAQHVHAEPIRKEFIQRMDYLNDYGGTVSDEDHRRRFQVHLGADFSQHSFAVAWYRLREGEYQYAFNGGLIWHGGPNDPLTITISPQWWGVHT